MRAVSEADASSLPPSGQAVESIAVRLRLYLNEAGQTSSADYVEFDANLGSVSYGSNVGELVGVDVSFEATGQIARSRV